MVCQQQRRAETGHRLSLRGRKAGCRRNFFQFPSSMHNNTGAYLPIVGGKPLPTKQRPIDPHFPRRKFPVRVRAEPVHFAVKIIKQARTVCGGP